jgi:hypothetical protein
MLRIQHTNNYLHSSFRSETIHIIRKLLNNLLEPRHLRGINHVVWL